MLINPFQLNRITTRFIGKFNRSASPQRRIKPHCKLDRRPISNLLIHADHIINMLCDRLRLHLGMTSIQDHTLNTISKQAKHICQSFPTHQLQLPCPIFKSQTFDSCPMPREMHNLRVKIQHRLLNISWSGGSGSTNRYFPIPR